MVITVPWSDLTVVPKPVPTRPEHQWVRSGVQESNEPEVHSFDIEVVEFRASFSDQAPQNCEAASMFLDKLAKSIFLLKAIVNGRTDGDLWITHDVTVPKRPAFKIGKTGVGIRVVR